MLSGFYPSAKGAAGPTPLPTGGACFFIRNIARSEKCAASSAATPRRDEPRLLNPFRSAAPQQAPGSAKRRGVMEY